MKSPPVITAFLLGIHLLATGPASAADDEKAVEAFERYVRPLLLDRCADCHSGDEPESGLSVESLGGLLRGGLRGPAVLPGQPEESLLVRVLRHGESVKMPLGEKLDQREIAAVAEWIAQGAPWPGEQPALPLTNEPAAEGVSFSEEQRRFWAFQPPRASAPPRVDRAEWTRTPVDAFIMARLEAEGLTPAAPADRRTLLRRVTFDLTGLPPTAAEIDAFLADDSAAAYERVVERLLASPRYGERWGRHWLDVARYGDSNGLDENLAFANAFRYRDFVVRSFNTNVPYDRFVQLQLAGDLLVARGAAAPSEGIVATGFLCLGPKMLAEDDPMKLQMDIVDEQLDTLGRTLMGLTLGCARCHDHKFDPIPTSDYYAMAGILRSTRTMDTLTVVARWHEAPIATINDLTERDGILQQIEAIEQEQSRLRDSGVEWLRDEARRRSRDYARAALDRLRRRHAREHTESLGERWEREPRPNGRLMEAEAFLRGNVNRDTDHYGAGIGVLVNRGELPNFVEYEVAIPESGTYRLEVRYAAADARPCRLYVDGRRSPDFIAGGVTGSWFPESQRWEVAGWFQLDAGTHTIRLEQSRFFPHIDKLLIAPDSPPNELSDWSFDDSPELVPPFLEQWVQDLGPRFEADPDLRIGDQELQELTADPEGPFRAPEDVEDYLPDDLRARITRLDAEVDRHREQLPVFPHAMAVTEGDVQDLPVHIRGSHLTLGHVVPRHFLRILASESPAPLPDRESGRWELARWITSPDHPLTARVFVNRVWHWHFGNGLVRTPDNFGRLGDRPTHPELLDWLAVEFVASGWDTKWLHRQIVLSSTYRQASRAGDRAQGAGSSATDHENRLLSHFPRRRLEVEAIRDAMLAISGELDNAMGGSLLPTENRAYVTSTANVDPVIYDTRRRSVYLPVVRSALYDVYQAFDFADPNVVNGSRQETVVAPQALFLMNSAFVADRTRAVAESLLAHRTDSDEERLRKLWLAAYAREPDEDERERCLRYLETFSERWQRLEPDAGVEQLRMRAWQSLSRIVISSNEFIYVE